MEAENESDDFEREPSTLCSTSSEECGMERRIENNLEVLQGLQEQWPGGFFQELGGEWKVGRSFAVGGQATMVEAKRTLPDGTKDKWVLKRFHHKRLQDLIKVFSEGMLKNLGPNGHYSNGHSCSIYGGVMLQNGRFAFLMKRYWGDLRHLIDLRMRRNNNQVFPFPNMLIVVQIILDIALGMRALHEDGIVHRDLKSTNVLIRPLGEDYDPVHGGKFKCHVADFECSVGVLGTGFWRAPEIWSAMHNRIPSSQILFTEKSDVYSFAMTCYEILTGCIPFEGLRSNLHDVLQGTRPKLPESIDLWLKELLEMCWHQDPLQRPSFKEIVGILQARSVHERELDISTVHPLTWEEFNDPRVQSGQHQRIEIPNKFPILIKMLVASLQCCAEEFGKVKKCKDQGGMFKFQCAHLIQTLSSNVDKIFHQFQQVSQILKEPVITNAHRQQRELDYWSTCIAFGVHSLVDLTRNFQTMVKMLTECGAEDWGKTAIQYSTTPPHPQIPRWSVFGLALQQCQWSMDIAHLAIKEITDLAIGFGDWMFNDPKFQWCKDRQRLVLQNLEDLSGSLEVAATMEAQDRSELLKKLDSFLYKSLHCKSHKNEFKIASFLKTKLDGPFLEARYLPYTFQIDPPVNLVSRSPITAIWCDKILCHVKKVKGQAHEVRKLMERDAAPLAAVQHPNVVHLIGCTIQTSKQMIGLSKILTKMVYPSKKKRHHESTGVMVMELMEGDLRKLIDQRCPNPGPNSRPFSLIVALDIMSQIAEAMRFVHEHKILHRDLKTTNILFNTASTGAFPSYPMLDLNRIQELELLYLLTPERFYTVKVADFDMAKYSPIESSHIVDSKVGTPRYMAPEMFYNPEAEVPSKYNWSCDVYSFAMTCSAILTGNEPFHFVENPTMDNIASLVAEGEVRPDLGLGDALPNLKSLIERCWDKDPSKRPCFTKICKELWDCKVKATISCLRR